LHWNVKKTSICQKIFTFVSIFTSFILYAGGKRRTGGAGGMAWEATAGNWRRRRAVALGFGGLLLVRENHSKREVPLDRKVIRTQFTL